MKLLKTVVIVALLSVSRIGFSADARVAFTEHKEQLALQKEKKKEAHTLAKEISAAQTDSRRDYVESFKNALQQAKEQQKKVLAETKENASSRRKL